MPKAESRGKGELYQSEPRCKSGPLDAAGNVCALATKTRRADGEGSDVPVFEAGGCSGLLQKKCIHHLRQTFSREELIERVCLDTSLATCRCTAGVSRSSPYFFANRGSCTSSTASPRSKDRGTAYKSGWVVSGGVKGCG